MKKAALLCALLMGLSAFSWAQTPMQQAEELYRQGKFSAALSLYEAELKKVPNDPHVYYNIGNCYFKMGSKGLAAANYYRAFKLAPRDADIRHNLSLALAAGGERLVPAGMPAVLHEAFFYLSYPELKGLTFVLLWLFCVLASVWLIKRKFGRVLVACVVLLAASVARAMPVRLLVFWWCAVAVSTGIMLLTYVALWLQYTPVGATVVDGMQHRYFFPLVILMLLCGLECLRGLWYRRRTR